MFLSSAAFLSDFALFLFFAFFDFFPRSLAAAQLNEMKRSKIMFAIN